MASSLSSLLSSSAPSRHLVCSFCLEPFNETTRCPRLLSCGHTFCSVCLAKLIQNAKVLCPNDHHPTTHVECVDEIPQNFSLLALLSPSPPSPSPSPHSSVCPVMCSVCDDVATHLAIHYCVECEEYLCQSAANLHSKLKITRDHKVVTAEESIRNPKALSKVTCSTHTQPFVFFDTHCACLVCSHCLHLDHFGHKCQSLSDAGVECVKEIERLMVRVKERKRSVQTAEEEVSRIGEELRTRQQHNATEIKDTFAQLHEALSARESALQNELSQLRKKKSFVLDSQYQQLHTFSACLTSLTEHAQEVMSEGSDVALLLSLRSDMSTLLTALDRQPLTLTPKETPSLTLTVNTDMLLEGISQFGVVCGNSISSVTTTADGPGLTVVREGDVGKFTITTRNRMGEVCGKSDGDVFDVEVVRGERGENEEEEKGQSVDIFDNGDGTHGVTYIAPITGRGGEGRVSVCVNGENICGSPFRVQFWMPIKSLINVRTLRRYDTHSQHRSGGKRKRHAQDDMFDPWGVTVSPSGEVYVCERLNHRIQVFSSSGHFLRSWGVHGAANGQLCLPSDVAVSSSGEVFVCDWETDRIQVFDVNGRFLRSWGSTGDGPGQLLFPSSVALSPDGEVFVSDWLNHRIQVFDVNGQLFRTWGSQGEENGQFDCPSGLAISRGEVFVADGGNYRVQVFSIEGEFLRTWGSQGEENGQFEDVQCVAVSNAGDVIVSDRTKRRIQVFSADGRFIHKWGGEEDGNGMFQTPFGVAVSPTGVVYVCDYSKHCVHVFE